MPISLGTTTITALFLGTTSITSAYLGNTQVFGGSFSPLSLFSGGAQGVWYDPSDLSTMFSDRAGTTAVTTPGTVVGLRLDKSKGLALGAELVTNGTFDADISGWTNLSSGTATISWAAGAMRMVTNGSPNRAIPETSITTVVGKTYLLTLSWTVISGAPDFALNFATVSNGTAFLTTAASVTRFVFTATSTATYIRLRGAGIGTSDLDDFSVRELPGNHATAPTDAARPTYGIEPKGGRRNLLLATDTLATQSLSVTAVAHTLAFTGTGTVTLSGASTAGPLVGTGAGNRVSLTFTPTAASLTLTVSGSVTLGQLERASSATAYQKVTTAYDVTESGVATTHYVQYDGSDDSMSTAAIDFTATDKMSVFAGVRKLSDAAQGAIVELTTSASSPGAFSVFGPRNPATASYGVFFTGTLTVGGATLNDYAAPISNVITALGNISGDNVELRVNGVQAAQFVADQGTGNYANAALFIGRRNNTNLPFNGRDYGLIVVGKAASAGEITDTETWLAAKTSGVTL